MGWELLLKGILLGLSLSILVGPLLITIVQTSLEQGRVAGLSIGAGIWMSDILFILMVYFSIASIQQLTVLRSFELTMGIVGGLVLTIFGIVTLLPKATILSVDKPDAIRQEATWRLLLKGFLINTLNPFTFFFWISVTSTIVVDGSLSASNAFLFYGGLIGTIMLADSLKAIFADKLRTKLTLANILLMRKIASAILIFFGLLLIFRVL
ncbi:MAG: LysE family transporter [Bacteroidota bacterium]